MLEEQFFDKLMAILLLFANKFNKVCFQADAKRIKCLIFDDNVLTKTGKAIEKVSYLRDHVLNRCVFCYNLLVMGYWDGTSFLALNFSLHMEEGKNNEKPYGIRKNEFAFDRISFFWT